VPTLLAASDETWVNLSEADWIETFRSHPRIGESRPGNAASAMSQSWGAQEQRQVAAAGADSQTAMADANRKYEERFGHIFIVCATGKTAPEILEILQRRLR